MRIDQKKFPALFDNDIVIRHFKQWLDTTMIKMFYDVLNTAKMHLHYITSNIMEHTSDAFPKLLHLRDDLPDSCRGLLFMMGGRPHTFLYTITNHEDRVMITGQVYAVDVDGVHQFGDLLAGYFPKKSEKLEFHLYEYVKSNDYVAQEAVKIILANELFLNYAEIETKEVNPSRQIWDGPTCLYNNKTKFPITVVDSSWFTNLISSGAFKVRGHLVDYGFMDNNCVVIYHNGSTREVVAEWCQIVAKVENL